MEEETMDRKNLIVMKLLHYFITERNYNPIVLQGADDKIWLENMDEEYKIIRVVSTYLHNDEQLDFDLFKTKKIAKKIKRKTFSLTMNVLSIYIDLGDNVHLDRITDMKCMYLFDETNIDEYDFFLKEFPDIEKKLKFSEDGLQLFIKITNDINNKNKKNATKAEEVFKQKTPYITYALIAINIFIYFIGIFTNYDAMLNDYCVYGPLVRYGEYYRLFTGMFLHVNIFHLLINCYSLYLIGSQMESFMGKIKYLIIYIVSGLFGSLLSIIMNVNGAGVGASGAIFGLFGSMLYFGYHYRVYLGNVVKSQIMPTIVLNLIYGFMIPGIDNAAHIGGLLGGLLITTAVGVKYKSSKFEMINGWVVSILLFAFLIYMGIFNIK